MKTSNTASHVLILQNCECETQHSNDDSFHNFRECSIGREQLGNWANYNTTVQRRTTKQ